MSTWRGDDLPPDVKAAIDKRVAAALEAEYARERQLVQRSHQPKRRIRHVAAVGMAAGLVVVLLVGVLRDRSTPSDVGSGGTSVPVTISVVAPPQTQETAVAPASELHPRDVDSLVAALQAREGDLDALAEPLDRMGFTGTLHQFCVRDVPMLVLEYDTEPDRIRESASIPPDARILESRDGDVLTQWVAPPRFFAQGRIIVLVLGPDDATLDLLTRLLGDPLTPAGRGVGPSVPCTTPPN